MDWCMEGSSTYPLRKELLEKQKKTVEAEIAHMNQILDMLRFKCWYYEQAIKDGGEDRIKSLLPDRLPDEFNPSMTMRINKKNVSALDKSDLRVNFAY